MNEPKTMSCSDLEGAALVFALAGSLIYEEPSEETIARYRAERMFEEAPYAQANPTVERGLASAEAWLEALSDDAIGEAVAALKREWLALFVGVGEPKAPCIESFYHDNNGVVLGAQTLEVRRLYKRFGVELKKKHAEPDDQLGLMLGFMGHLLKVEHDAVSTGDELRAAEARGAQKDLLENHLLYWLPRWYLLAKEHVQSGYFDGVVDMVFGFVQELAKRFSIKLDVREGVFERDEEN